MKDVKLSYGYEEADALCGRAASADEAHDREDRTNADHDQWQTSQEQERRCGIVEQQDAVEQSFVADVHPQTNADQRDPAHLQQNAPRISSFSYVILLIWNSLPADVLRKPRTGTHFLPAMHASQYGVLSRAGLVERNRPDSL